MTVFLCADQVNLPAVHSFHSAESQQYPVLVEVHGGGKKKYGPLRNYC